MDAQSPVGKQDSVDLENKHYFDRWARTYDLGRLSRWFQYTQGLAIGLLELRSDSAVLDIGCGTGYAVLSLGWHPSVRRACGIDISVEMIKAARGKVPETLKDKVEFVVGNSQNVPYPTGAFDHILCTNSFHHYPEPIRALEEMGRVLKPGGQLVILENAPDLSWYTRAWDYALRIVEKGHIRYYSRQELQDMLRRAGYRNARLAYAKRELMKHGKLSAAIQVWTARTFREEERSE